MIEIAALRYTPAGIPAVELVLEHTATTQNGTDADFSLPCVAFSLNAQSLEKVKLGTQLKCSGFLRQASKSKASKKLLMQIEQFEII